jgi:hypothetical protein
MTALFVIVVLYAAFLVVISKAPGEAVKAALAGVWVLMALVTLGSVLYEILRRY